MFLKQVMWSAPAGRAKIMTTFLQVAGCVVFNDPLRWQLIACVSDYMLLLELLLHSISPIPWAPVLFSGIVAACGSDSLSAGLMLWLSQNGYQRFW